MEGRFIGSGALLALLVLAAVGGGYAARLIRVPRVVGYLIAGVGLRFALVGLFAAEGDHAYELAAAPAEPLQPIKTLALGLILFAIGGVFEPGHVKAVGRKILRISLTEITAVLLLVTTGCTLTWWLTGSSTIGPTAACGLLLGAMAIATAPAATVLVLQEYEAKGPVSDTLLSLTALNNTTCITVFHVFFVLLATFGVIATPADGGGFVWLDLVATTCGSVLLGVILGFVASVLYAKSTLAEFVLILLGTLLALGQGSRFLADQIHVSYSFLLTCLALGATFANLAVDQDRLHDAIRQMAGPIYASFFVLAGYELHLSGIGDFGLVGVAYCVLRVAGKCLGGFVGRTWADPEGDIPGYVGCGLLCQAGVAIGLVDFLGDSWGTVEPGGFSTHPLATRLHTIVVGSVVLFELGGPLALKSVIMRAGEIKAITLLRRHQTPAATASLTRLAWDAVLRTVGLSRPATHRPNEPLRVRHIMRSNIKLLPAEAAFDDVLHYVERSRYNDFPVADEAGRLIGMIHFSELRKMIYDPLLRDLVTAMDLADLDTPAVPVDLPLTELLEEFHRANTGLLPVVESRDSRKIVGLVEQRDLLRDMPKPG